MRLKESVSVASELSCPGTSILLISALKEKEGLPNVLLTFLCLLLGHGGSRNQ